MNALKCEMCMSSDIVKDGGVFICQNCGTKYSVEEVKKMMIEGTVDVSGSTVKLDYSSELKNLYEIARRAKNDNNSENAQKYYEQILVKDPSSWEANFYTVFYQSMNCKIAGIQNAAVRLCNCEDTVLKLIRDNVKDCCERFRCLTEVSGRLKSISSLLYNSAMKHYNGIGDSIRYRYTQEMLNNCCSARNIVYYFGDYVTSIFGDDYGLSIAVSCWKQGIAQHKELLPFFQDKVVNKNVILKYSSKIQKYDSSYQAPTFDDGGCYVATAVYGSYDCPQVWTLRRYRDYELAESWYGRAFIRTYYAISPTLVKWFGHTEWFKRMWKGKLDRMVEKLQAQGFESGPYNDRQW